MLERRPLGAPLCGDVGSQELGSLAWSPAMPAVPELTVDAVGIECAPLRIIMSSHGDVFEVYLLFRPFREVVPEMRVLVQPLSSIENTVPLRAEGYHSTALDSALVALRFDRVPAHRFGLDRITRWVADIGIPAIVPENLAFERRCAFFLNHLTSYTTYVQPHSSDSSNLIENVLVSLAQHARITPNEVPEGTFALTPHGGAFQRTSTALPY